ncbi:chemotaxis protein CheA [Desulfonatronospira sp.]|uniref:chemotaxis protein CheA n=1 Tax=Desulfonatronospira sp. TaxID=1962951 RepID=UPI0025BAFE98|nr:chemotaxis protein CheA [Desulfonatronospira sp.]
MTRENMSDKEKMQQAFLEEAGDLLPELETALLELDSDPGDADLVNRVFRALHTIKGSGAMFGFEEVAEFTHELENAFEMVRCGELQVSKELLDLTLSAKDQIQNLLGDPQDHDQEAMQSILEALKEILPLEHSTQGQGEGLEEEQQPAGEKLVYRIRFKPEKSIFATGTNPLHLLEEIRELGQACVIAHGEDIPPLDKIDPEQCHVWWDIILTTTQGKNAIQDVFIFVDEDSELNIQLIDHGTESGQAEGYRRLGEILTERGDISRQELESVLGNQKRLGELLIQAGLVSRSQVETALVEQQTVRKLQEERTRDVSSSSVRVPAAKLDDLVNLVGELVIAQAKLTRMIGDHENRELKNISEEIERLSDELRDNTLGIRMLPIGSSFGKFRRVVRDLSSQKGKEIELVTEGAETELDKTVIERINDPLVHLLRNSIDHGIESPAERVRLGKPRQGTITFSAMQSGGNVVLTIRDDGRGMDPEVIKAKALEKGIIPPGAELSGKEILNLIFLPGFSTSREISDISGRGVGMDVVKQNINALRGRVEADSIPGQGSTIRISLPLTLAIIEGLQVRVGEQYFIIPLSVVSECVELTSEEKQNRSSGRLIPLRDTLVPYIRLREWFLIEGVPPAIEQVVMVSSTQMTVGLAVDEVIGQQQTVIKNLGQAYQDVQGIYGATINGDGSIALILDIEPLVRDVRSNESNPAVESSFGFNTEAS